MSLRIRMTMAVIAGCWVGHAPPATADVVTKQGRVESLNGNLVSLSSRNVLGLESSIVLRFDPAIVAEKGLDPGREIHVEYDDGTRTISRILAPEDREEAGGRTRDPAAGRASAREPRRDGDSGNTWVLLIGIEKYEHLDVLKYPSEDVDALEAVYRTHGGVDPSRILKITDGSGNRPTSATLSVQIRDFLRKPRAGDRVVVFFSGHGVLDKPGGVGYLAASDCDPSSQKTIVKTAIAIDALLAWIADSAASNKILMLDACHSGAFDGRQLKKDLGDQPGVVTIAGCGNDQGSVEDDGTRHGMFTNWLVEALSGAADTDLDGRVTSLELAHWLDKASGSQKIQNPTHNHPPNIGQPVALTLHGLARELNEAERLGIDDRYDEAMIALQDVPACDDLNLEFRRRALLDRFSKGSNGVFLALAGKDVDSLSPETLANPYHRARAIKVNLMLAKSHLKSGDTEKVRLEGYRSRVKKARELIDGVTYLPLRVQSVIAVAETMHLEEEFLTSAKARDAAKKAVTDVLTTVYAVIMSRTTPDIQIPLLCQVGGAARRINNKAVFDQYTEWVTAEGRDTLQRSRVFGLALADGGDIPGAVAAMMTYKQYFPANVWSAEQPPLQARIARAAVDMGEFATYRAAVVEAEKWIALDTASKYANTVAAIADLGVACARAGEIDKAEGWLAKLPTGSAEAGAVLAEICCATARDADFAGAREILKRVPQNLEQIEACYLLAKAEIITSPDRCSDLISWIKGMKTPLDRAAAYAGLVDGLEKRPWNRLVVAWTDDYRRELLVKNGVAGQGGSAPTIASRAGESGYDGGRSFASERPRIAMNSVVNDVSTGFAIASVVQSFTGGNIEGGAWGVATLVAPEPVTRVRTIPGQLEERINRPIDQLPGPVRNLIPRVSIPRFF